MLTVLEPIKPVPVFAYTCDARFRTEVLEEMLESDQKFGFIIVDGSGTLMATVSGHQQTVLWRYGVQLPKKHGRGGQSALRFARLRMEARNNYVTKVKEAAVTNFIDPETSRPNVAGLILAGSADLKDIVSQALDPRLPILGLFDIQYGMLQGLHQAINLAEGTLKTVGLVQEKKIVSQFFEEIARDSGKISYGMKDTLPLLDGGVIQTLLLWENLPDFRTVIREADGETTRVVFCSEIEIQNRVEKGEEVVESEKLVDWLAENYHNFGFSLVIIGDTTPEGSQFCRSFGGVGAILRYACPAEEAPEEDATEDGKQEEDEDDESQYWM